MSVGFLLGLAALSVVVLLGVFVRRKRGRLSPAENYQRDVKAVQLATYRQTTGRGYTRQVGEPFGYVGPLPPPGC